VEKQYSKLKKVAEPLEKSLKLFLVPLPIFARFKRKAAVKAKKIRSRLPTTIRGGMEFLKDSQRIGEFSEKPCASSTKTVSIDTTFSQIHLARQCF
jgi:hypothetical protein